MANEVEIRITANDMTGPAFAGAMGRLSALKKAADDVAGDRQMQFNIGDAMAKLAALKALASGISLGKVDSSALGASLTALRSKIQSLGIADLADVNVQPGRLMTQLQLIKRLITQAGISDVLDFNLTPADLTSQLEKLGHMQYEVPVKFDVSHMPNLGDIGSEQFTIPIKFDVSKIPVFGQTGTVINILQHGQTMPILDIPANIDIKNIPVVGATQNINKGNSASNILQVVAAEKALQAANEAVAHSASDADVQLSPLMQRMLALAADVDSGTKYMGGFGDALVSLLPYLGMLSTVILANSSGLRGWGSAITTVATNIGSGLLVSTIAAGNAIKNLDDNISLGIPMWQSAGNLWFGLGGHIQLFAGALTHVGIPAFISTASGLHLLTDGIIEVGATLIPAIIGLGAFAAAAVDTTNVIQNHFKNMNIAIDATGKTVYPLTGSFSAMNKAAQPEVYVLLGEGLQVVNKNAGILQTIALAAGKSLDDLGARFTYAMTSGGGFGTFMKNSATDLSGWGTLIGNIGGIIGNFLKVMPGYAEIILNVANAVTHLAENITGSGLGQGILSVALAMHGFILYAGLIGTGAAVLISRTLPALALGIYKVGAAFDVMGASSVAGALKGFAVQAEDAATLPWGWITLAAAGIGVLVYQFLNAKSAAQQFADAAQKTIEQTKLSSLGNTLSYSMMGYAAALGQATAQTTKLQAATAHTQLVDVGKSVQQVTVYSAATYTAMQNVSDYAAALNVARQDQATYNSNLAMAAKVFGSNQAALAALTNAGITSTQMLTTSKQQMAENIIEAQAYNDALRALTNGTGEYGAMINALSGPEQYLGDFLKNIQTATAAQDAAMAIVTAGVTAFDTYGQGLHTIGVNAAVAGASIGGLNDQSFALNASFYAEETNAQKVIDALEQQETSAKNMTAATATMASELLFNAGSNNTARASIVAMINNALGPGTVSLQTLNTWVGKNSTSFQGLSTIIDQASVKAGTLANILQTQLNAQFQADLLQSSGATTAMKNFTDAIVNSGNNSNATKNARATLIGDLEKTGMSATDAKNYVNNLQTQIDSLHGKSVSVTTPNAPNAKQQVLDLNNSILHLQNHTSIVRVVGQGSGAITATENIFGMKTQKLGSLTFVAGGGPIKGQGGPKQDNLPVMASAGEWMMQASAVDKYGTGFMAAVNAGKYANGGLINTNQFAGASTWMGNDGSAFIKGAANAGAPALMSAFLAAAAKQAAAMAAASVPTIATAGSSGGIIATMMRNMAAARGWTGTQWSALYDVEMREAGFNMTATNPTSGAYGLAQFINGPSEYAQYGGNSTTATGQITGMLNYIAQRYGNPINAWAHEQAYNWYDHGGILKPGATMAYNGTGQNEYVVGPQGLTVGLQVASGGSSAFESFMLEMIRNFVRIKGGGNVQTAFGRNK
jgi:hypothetical protein